MKYLIKNFLIRIMIGNLAFNEYGIDKILEEIQRLKYTEKMSSETFKKKR